MTAIRSASIASNLHDQFLSIMHIHSLDLFHIALPLRQPGKIAGRDTDRLETVLVRMQSAQTVGWGEASPGSAPTIGAEWAAGVFACVRDWLGPAMVGAEVDTPEQLAERLKPFRGNQFAKSAIDTAWWDLNARLQNKPLHQLIGGQRQSVEVGVTFDRMDSIDEFAAAIHQAVDAGFSRVGLMFRPGWDVHMVDFVRKEFPLLTMHIDVEGDLTLGYLDMLCRLDDFSLAMIEQPLPADDLVGHAMVQEAIRTPICLDEAITTLSQANMALELHSCRYVNLKLGRVGGLTPAIAIHNSCQDSSVPCWVGAMPQSAIGARLGYALAAKTNCTYPTDYLPSDAMFTQDLAPPLVPAPDPADGKMRIRLWDEPGIGVEPEQELLERFSMAQARLG